MFSDKSSMRTVKDSMQEEISVKQVRIEQRRPFW